VIQVMRFKSPTFIALALFAAALLGKIKPGYGFSSGGW